MSLPTLMGSQQIKRHDHLTFKANLGRGRHGWIRLTPAYSVHLVEELISRGGPEQLVLDPFCGTGTTPLLCSQKSITGHAIDINPFLVWLGKLKCTQFTDEQCERFRAVSHQVVSDAASVRGEPWVPPIAEISKWWSQPELRALARLYAAIQKQRAEDRERIHDLLLLSFCRTLISVAHVSFGHQSMSFKKPLAEGRLPGFSRARVDTVFLQTADAISAVMTEALPGEVEILLGDSRDLPLLLSGRKYTTVVTSPPYPNRMSYIRELRPYMFWLQLLANGREAGELDWRAIGGTWGCATGYLPKWKPDPRVVVPHDGFEAIVEQITRRSHVLGQYVRKYFEDAILHIRSLKEVLTPDAAVYYVVGNSKFYDVMLPVEQIYASMFRATGFRKVRVQTIRKRTSKKELFEFVVEAAAP